MFYVPFSYAYRKIQHKMSVRAFFSVETVGKFDLSKSRPDPSRSNISFPLKPFFAS